DARDPLVLVEVDDAGAIIGSVFGTFDGRRGFGRRYQACSWRCRDVPVPLRPPSEQPALSSVSLPHPPALRFHVHPRPAPAYARPNRTFGSFRAGRREDRIIADSYPPSCRRSRTKCVRGASRDLAVIMAAGPMNRTSSYISDAAAVRWIIADTYPPVLGG